MSRKRASGTKHARIRETVCKILSIFLPLKTFIPNFVAFFVSGSGAASSCIFKISASVTLAKREFTLAILFTHYRPLSHGGHFESQENKKLCFCTSSLALDERLAVQNLLFQHCVIKVYSLGGE